MDLLLAILIGITALIIYYVVIAIVVAMIPIVVGLGIFIMVSFIAYVILKSRH